MLFPFTQNTSHPLASEGIVDLLMKLTLLESVRANNISVLIVFVVPVQMSATYQPQPVQHNDIFDLSFEKLCTFDCSAVPNIAKAEKRRLNDIGI